MKKTNKRETINLFFSAFLIIAFIVCANFFSNFTASIDTVPAQIITVLVYAVFGLLLFYATRVGDGKAVKRFSPLTLIILVLPTLYIIVASIAPFMPLHDVFAADALTGKLSVITALSSVALGYGLPYSFFSGFELASEDDEEPEEEDERRVLAGGIEADLLEADQIADAVEAEEEEAAMQETAPAADKAQETAEENDESEDSSDTEEDDAE